MKVQVFTTPIKTGLHLVGLEFVDSLPVGTMFCTEGSLAWVKLDKENRCMCLDGKGCVTSPIADWRNMPMFEIAVAKFEY